MTIYSTNFDKTLPFSDHGFQLGLDANVTTTFTVPGDISKTYCAIFSFPYNANVWVGQNKTPTTPTQGVSAATVNFSMNPDRKYVRGGDVLSFLSNANVSDIGCELFTLPG